MLTLYPARSIITMNDSMPRASAVLVRDGLIIEVGERENMQPWLDRGEYQVDEQFSDKVICPGFIDPHLHPSMAAVLLPMEFVTAMRWKLPWGTVEPTTSPAAFDARMQTLHAGKNDADESQPDPLFIWGFHQLWHGSMSKDRISAISTTRPIVVWHRSFHELYMNDAAMEMASMNPDEIKQGDQIICTRCRTAKGRKFNSWDLISCGGFEQDGKGDYIIDMGHNRPTRKSCRRRVKPHA